MKIKTGTVLSLLFFSLLPVTNLAAADQGRPNILIVTVDDMKLES